MRRCSGCRRVLPLDRFSPNRARKDGYQNECRECHRETCRRSRLIHRETQREYHLKRKYGLTIEDLETLKRAQGSGCAICGLAKELVVDHDHTTGQVRGLLCESCNKALGFFEAGLRYESEMRVYLEQPPVREYMREFRKQHGK